LSEESYSSIVSSPLRQKIGARLAKGEAAVWILLESGDAEKDGSAHETLTAQLASLAGTLELPASVDAKTDIPISFAIERLARSDPAEVLLINMLLSTEPDLRDPEFDGLPMVFPVFGRGRVLYALIGEGINPDTIREACEFLTGACSCEIKDLNPGADLLLAMDWKSAIADPVRSVTKEEVAHTASNSYAVGVGSVAAPESVIRNVVLACAVLVGIVLIGTFAAIRRNQSP
jgi:hypothetical protein